MKKPTKEELKKMGLDFDKSTFNLDKMSGIPGFHKLLDECEYDFHKGSRVRKLVDFIWDNFVPREEVRVDKLLEEMNKSFQDYLDVCDRVAGDKSRTGVEAAVTFERVKNKCKNLTDFKQKLNEK